MAQTDRFDVVLLGSGPGGYVAAIRGAQLGLKVAVVERDAVGGVCLNWGCIPSKALLHYAELVSEIRRSSEWGVSFDSVSFDYATAVKRSRESVKRLTSGVAGLLRKHKVEVIAGTGVITSPTTVSVNQGERTVEGANLMISTGGRPRPIAGVEIDYEVVVTSREAIEMPTVPEHCVIIGGGAIGAEFAYIYRQYGARVTVVEMLPHLLPSEDVDISVQLEKEFAKQKIDVMTGAKVESVTRKGKKAQVTVSSDGKQATLEADRVIVAIGIQPNSEQIGLETIGVETERGWITVDDQMRTNVPGVYAIGDVTGKMLLAHVAFRQGEMAMEVIAGHHPKPIDYRFAPRATYCIPQVASFGLTEAQAREAGTYEVEAFKFPFRGVGKAVALNDYEGFCKLVIDKRWGELLGAHLIGPGVTELLPELTLAREVEASVVEIGESIHAHPTLSEVLKEAALGVLGRPIHI